MLRSLSTGSPDGESHEERPKSSVRTNAVARGCADAPRVHRGNAGGCTRAHGETPQGSGSFSNTTTACTCASMHHAPFCTVKTKQARTTTRLRRALRRRSQLLTSHASSIWKSSVRTGSVEIHLYVHERRIRKTQ